MNTSDWVTWLRGDQRARWEKGDRVRVESYLKRHTRLGQDSEALLDLIYNEVVLREEAKERPQLGEYVQRFPALAVQLHLLFEVHQALEEDDLEEDDLVKPTEGDNPEAAVVQALARVSEVQPAPIRPAPRRKRVIHWRTDPPKP
jgi:hypothetical protein